MHLNNSLSKVWVEVLENHKTAILLGFSLCEPKWRQVGVCTAITAILLRYTESNFIVMYFEAMLNSSFINQFINV